MQSDKSKALIDSITDSINTLATMTDATAKSDLFKTWLRAVSRFHHYSFNNQLLVLLQRPQAERVAGFHTWKSLGRNVKKGAKGIAILAPCVRKLTAEEAAQRRAAERVSAMKLCGFRVTHVFDIADTEGKDIPELEYRAEAGGETLLPRLESAAAAMGIVLEYREETGSANGWSEGGKVVVNATLSTTAKCGTLAHELAHEFLHQHGLKAEKTPRKRVGTARTGGRGHVLCRPCPLRHRAALRPLSGQLGRHRREHHRFPSHHPRCRSLDPWRNGLEGRCGDRGHRGLAFHRHKPLRASREPIRHGYHNGNAHKFETAGSASLPSGWSVSNALVFHSRRSSQQEAGFIVHVLRPPHRRVLLPS